VRFLRFLAALVAVTLIHLAGVRVYADFPRLVDLFVVLVVLHALGSGSLGGLTGGMLAGLVHDALTGGPYGLYGFADTIVGYLAARVAQRLIIERASGVMAVVVVAALVQQAILVGLATLVLGQRHPPVAWWWAISPLASGLVGAASYLGGDLFSGVRERRRRERVARLRLGK
jgi:rod shape-determining protein MreD